MPSLLRMGLWGFYCAVLMLCNGCVSTKPYASSRPTATVLVTEYNLIKEIKIRSQRSRTDKAGIFIGMTELKNLSGRPLVLDAQTFFKDAEGQTIDRSDWRVITLPPYGAEPYHTASVKKEIRAFVVYLHTHQEEFDQFKSASNNVSLREPIETN